MEGTNSCELQTQDTGYVYNSEDSKPDTKTDEAKTDDVKSTKASRDLYIVTEESEVTQHSFVFRHKDEVKEERSIFDVHKKHLTSTGNQRPSTQPEGEPSYPTSPRPLRHEADVTALPGYVPTPPVTIDKPPNRKLYDYRDFQYLEQSRRKRRRKKSEVDINIVYNLSRFVTRPYEGALDKYSDSNPKPKSRGRTSQIVTSSSHSPKSRSRTFVSPDCDVTKYLRQRRRSISASPPRIHTSQLHPLFRGSRSTRTSPIYTPTSSPPTSSPPTSQLASPLLRRYQRSTFRSILDHVGGKQDNCKLPDIYAKNGESPKLLPRKQFDTLSTSYPGAKHRVDNNQKMTKEKNNDKASPTSHKRVLLNTSLPIGSPTFQRAMKGFNPAVGKSGEGKTARVRIASAGGRKVGRVQRMTSATGNDDEMNEIRDSLGSLSVGTPPKSILKNRRRSIDDLDIGTKKGLALYLKSKQQH
ncbi:uncharacterized protein LOC100177604 [Ciona intestinalis]